MGLLESINGPLQDLWLTRAGGVRPVGRGHPSGLLRSNRRLKPQISHGFLAPFEGFPDASPGVLQVWENVGIQVIMGLSTGLCRIYGKTWDTGDHLSTLPYISVRCHATGHLVASLTGSTNGQGVAPSFVKMARAFVGLGVTKRLSVACQHYEYLFA